MRTKKSLMILAVVAAVAVVVGLVAWLLPSRGGAAGGVVGPDSAAVARAEEARAVAGADTIDVSLTAGPATVEVGGQAVDTWAFNGTVPGPAIRASAGDVLRAEVVNDLPEELTIHWHGIALRNDMDGVPDLTQEPIAPGAEFTYEFTLPDAGTYFYHSHVGTQLDRGLYGSLVVDDPDATPAAADVTLLLDDWIDGTGQTPDDVLEGLTSSGMDMGEESMPGMDMGEESMPGMDMGEESMPGMDMGEESMPGMDMGEESMPGMDMGEESMPGMDMGEQGSSAASSPLGTDISDVSYPMYLINGRTSDAPEVQRVSAGDQVRLRLVNAASSVPFRVAFGGGPMTVIATDGFPVEPVSTDALLMGMGERYDVLVTVPEDGAFPLVAAVEGGPEQAMAVLQTDD
ncbi:MAG: multicopper oxidase domain-containing protein, partial [Agrococcus sp.]